MSPWQVQRKTKNKVFLLEASGVLTVLFEAVWLVTVWEEEGSSSREVRRDKT